MKIQKKSQRRETLANKNSVDVETLVGDHTSQCYLNHTPPGDNCQFSGTTNLNARSTSPVLNLKPIPKNPLTAKQAWTLGKLAARIGRPRFWLLKESCGIDIDTPIPYLDKSQASRLIQAIIEDQEGGNDGE